ncbi:MAG: hypothetical protein WC972_10700 [Trueperaceae bacterium]|nr:hypothetical protein [Trueperaceae bacterium]HRQ10336.1 hypothetical protein [Trueperaceae bacterium]
MRKLRRAPALLAVLALILAACSTPPAEKPPFIDLTSNQAASVVIGQPDFTSASEADVTRLFSSPYGRPLLLNDVLYLPDYGKDRVMGYLGVPTTNGAAADFVLGRDGFNDSASAPVSASRMDGPQSLATDGTRLFQLEYSSNRILVYDTPPTTTYAPADHVIGQTDFVTDSSDCTATKFDSPEGMYIQGDKLIVADSSNNRVMIWNQIPADGTTPADIVLGQNAFDTCAANDDAQVGTDGPASTARTLDYPTEVWTDGKILIVADADNNRVLIWNTFPTSNFAQADVVLGQAGFGTNAPGVGASKLDYPQSLHSNGTQLFVADGDNNRVLIWDAIPTANGQPADKVLGQADMDSALTDGGSVTPTAMGLAYPSGVYAFGNNLLVSDNDNARYLIFEGAVAP